MRNLRMREIDLMPEDRIKWGPDSAEEPRPEERPWWLMPLLIVACVLMIAGVLLLADKEPDDMPADIPAPDECTAEYVEQNGICLTWHDYHDGQPTYTQAP